jgi:hypothetical protein
MVGIYYLFLLTVGAVWRPEYYSVPDVFQVSGTLSVQDLFTCITRNRIYLVLCLWFVLRFVSRVIFSSDNNGGAAGVVAAYLITCSTFFGANMTRNLMLSPWGIKSDSIVLLMTVWKDSVRSDK